MGSLVGKTHLVDKQLLGRINSAIMLGMVGSGLAACVIAAAIYDIERLMSAW